MSLAFGLDKSQQLAMRDEELNQFNLLATFHGSTVMMSERRHLHADLLHRLAKHCPDLHTHIRQYRLKDTCIYLVLDAVLAADPQIAQAQQSFGQQKGFFDAPSSCI